MRSTSWSEKAFALGITCSQIYAGIEDPFLSQFDDSINEANFAAVHVYFLGPTYNSIISLRHRFDLANYSQIYAHENDITK